MLCFTGIKSVITIFIQFDVRIVNRGLKGLSLEML